MLFIKMLISYLMTSSYSSSLFKFLFVKYFLEILIIVLIKSFIIISPTKKLFWISSSSSILTIQIKIILLIIIYIFPWLSILFILRLFLFFSLVIIEIFFNSISNLCWISSLIEISSPISPNSIHPLIVYNLISNLISTSSNSSIPSSTSYSSNTLIISPIFSFLIFFLVLIGIFIMIFIFLTRLTIIFFLSFWRFIPWIFLFLIYSILIKCFLLFFFR